MNTCSASEAKNNLFELIDRTNKTHQPIRLKGEHNNAVLISDVDYEKLVRNTEIDENGWIKGTFDFNPEDKDKFPTIEEIRKNFGGQVMQYLLDTCTVSYYLRLNNKVIKNVTALESTELAISVITVLELECGFKLNNNSSLRGKWLLLCRQLNILGIGYKTALIAAEIKASLTKQGKIIGYYDILIAANALEYNLTCVTNNTKEFDRIRGLSITDWSV